MGKTLLVICRSVPPESTGSAVIVENIIRYFDRDKISVIGQTTAKNNTERMEGLPSIEYYNTYIGLFGRGQRYLKWLKFPGILRSAIKKAKSDGVTCILSVFPDEFYLYLGYRISKALDIPFYSWFHNTYLDNANGLRRIIAKYIQPKIFQHANTNFVMSDGILNEFNQLYPGIDFKTLVHGFKIPEVQYQELVKDDDIIRFAFTGSLNASNDDAALRLIKIILEDPKNEIHVYSGNAKSFLESRGINHERIIYHGFVTLEQLNIELKGYDMMLLPHGFTGDRSAIEFKTIFPTRTIPLLYCTRPILAHSPKNVFLTEFLQKHNCAYVIDSDNPNLIREKIETVKEDKRLHKELTLNAIKTAQIFNIDNVLDTIKQEINF